MKLAATLLCRDERDIIQQWVDFHRPKVDIMLVVDNGSTDGTLEYLQARKDIILSTQPSNIYFSDEWTTTGRRQLQKEGVNWIFHGDADEFWTGDLRKEAESAEGLGHDVIWVQSQRYFPTSADPKEEPNPIKRLQYLERGLQIMGIEYAFTPSNTQNFSQTPNDVLWPQIKVFYNAQSPLIECTMMGNHGVLPVPEVSRTQPAELVSIRHYFCRSAAHFVAKIMRGIEKYKDYPDVALKGYGAHYRMFIPLITEKGTRGLLEYYYNSVEKGSGDPALIHDPSMAEGRLV